MFTKYYKNTSYILYIEKKFHQKTRSFVLKKLLKNLKYYPISPQKLKRQLATFNVLKQRRFPLQTTSAQRLRHLSGASVKADRPRAKGAWPLAG